MNVISTGTKKAITELQELISNNSIPSNLNKWVQKFDDVDESFSKLIVDVQNGSKTTKDLQKYMDSASKSTAKFGAAFKSIAANIGIMLAINVAISVVTKAWDKLNVTVAETQEKIDELNSSLETLNSEYAELNNRDYETLSQSEKDRIEYVEKRIQLEQKLLDIQNAKLNQELVGNGFTDLFDEENFNAKLYAAKKGQLDWWDAILGVISPGLSNIDQKIKDTGIFMGDGDISDATIDTASITSNYHAGLYSFIDDALPVLNKFLGEDNWFNSLLNDTLDKEKEILDGYELSLSGMVLEYEKNISKLDEIINDPLSTESTVNNAKKTKEQYEQTLESIRKTYNYISNMLHSSPSTIDSLDEKLSKISKEELQNNFSSDEIKLLNDELVTDEHKDATIEEIKTLLDEVQTVVDENPVDITISLDTYSKASDSISSLASAHKELADNEYISLEAISKIKEAVGSSISNWDEYEQKLLSVQKGTEEYDKIMGELTYATLENQLGGVEKLANASEEYVTRLLEENGVLHANKVAQEAIERATVKNIASTIDLENATEEEILALKNKVLQYGYTEGAFWNLIAQEQIYNSTTLDVSQKISALQTLARQAGVTSEVIANLTGASSGIDKINDAMALGVTTDKNGDITFNGTVYGKGQDALNKAMTDASAYAFQKELEQKYKDIAAQYKDMSTSYSDNGSNGNKEEEFNWIETKISRLQRTITNFGKTVSATWKSWTDRNSALKDQISAVTNEINLQQQAADEYWTLAESVTGLGNYKGLIQDGALDISTIADENTIDAIKKYQEYYEAYLSALDAKQDAEDELASLKQTKADNISTEYDDLVSFIEHEKSMLDSTADLLENKGYMASASIYDKLIQYEYDTISTLEEKYKKLNENLNNSDIQEGSKQWYDMKLEIFEVEEAILESKNTLVEYNNTLQDLDWEVFDKLQEKIEGIISESEFLIELMSDEKMFDEGKITEHGQATLGLYALNYKTYLAQAEQYSQKLEEIREDIENDPYNQTLVEQEKKWTEALRDSVLASEDALQSIVDLKQEGFDSLLESLDNAITKYKDLINEQKNAYDYQKQIDNLTSDVTKYQKIMKSLEGMEDTEEGKKLIQEYSVKLRDSEEALAEAENEKYLEDLDKLLQNLSDDATEFVSQKMDNVDALIEEVINQTETNTGSILDTLKTETSNVNTTITSEMEKVWGTNGTFTTSLNSVVDIFKQYFDSLQKDSNEKANDVNGNIPNDNFTVSGNATNDQTGVTQNINVQSNNASGADSSNDWKSALVYSKFTGNKSVLNTSTSIVDLLKSHDYSTTLNDRANLYNAMGGSGQYVGSSSQNRFMINTMKSAGFAQGGTIGNLIKTTGEDGFVLARTGEGILTPENMKMLENVMTTMNPIVNSLTKLPSLPNIQSRYGGDTQVTFEGGIQMYGVNDPVEFEKQLLHHMKNSRPVRMVMKDTTIGEALGKNSMIRYTR